MSAYKTVELSRTGDGSVIFDRTVTKWAMDSYPANAQVSVAGLPALGRFNVDLMPAGHESFKRHVTDATGDDLVMLSGKEAPIFQQIRVTASATAGAELTVYLTLWERGI
tara:strand:+ start:95 stop:424 length:330 start_codon:yes stop_codon:yes gene_type:complete